MLCGKHIRACVAYYFDWHILGRDRAPMSSESYPSVLRIQNEGCRTQSHVDVGTGLSGTRN